MEVEPSSLPSKSLVDQPVVPGDIVLDLTNMATQTIKLGQGLRQDCDEISVLVSGKLKFIKPNKYWVESSQKRYVPSVEDTVLGIVVDSRSDNFLVDIKGPMLAFLPVLAFEGGTRRNVPKFEVGTLLYLRVVKANNIMNPEVSCTDASGKAAEFGLLKDGYMFETSTGLCRICSWEEVVFRDSHWFEWESLGECILAGYGYHCFKCNNEVRVPHWSTAENHGGKANAEIAMTIDPYILGWFLPMVYKVASIDQVKKLSHLTPSMVVTPLRRCYSF